MTEKRVLTLSLVHDKGWHKGGGPKKKKKLHHRESPEKNGSGVVKKIHRFKER